MCIVLEAMGNLHLAHPDICGLFTSGVMVLLKDLCHTSFVIHSNLSLPS